VVKQFLKNHLLTIPAGENVIRILPPLIIEKKHIKDGITKINKALLELRINC